MPSENQTKQVLERVFFDLLTTQQQSISRQLKQTITQSEKKLLLTKPLLITAQSPAKLIQERWLIDQSAQPILAASSATLTNHNLSHISRFVLIKRDHHYWIIQQTYRGNLPLNQEELGMWFSSLTIQ